MDIFPEVLKFEAPLDEQVTRPLVLTNTTDENIAYKIKTTAPKLYCVRPNASVILPGQKVEVSIIRQGKDETAEEVKSHKDKFLVLSTPVAFSEAGDDFAELWTDMEREDKASGGPKKITSKKIRVVYSAPSSRAATDDFHTPVKDGLSGSHAGGDVNGSAAGGLAEGTAVASGIASAGIAAASSNGGSTVASRHVAQEPELQNAEDKIAKLTQDIKSEPTQNGHISENGSSGSKSIADSSKTRPAALATPKSAGVPVPLVVILTLLTFLIGWKFF